MSSRPARAEVGDDHVQAVIDGGACLRPFSTRCRARRACGCRAPGWRNRRWWWCRRTPRRACRFRNRRATWCRRRACRDGCGIDAAGDDVHAGGVDHLGGGVRGDAGADFLDAFAFDQDVGVDGFGGGDDRAVADQGVHWGSRSRSVGRASDSPDWQLKPVHHGRVVAGMPQLALFRFSVTRWSSAPRFRRDGRFRPSPS